MNTIRTLKRRGSIRVAGTVLAVLGLIPKVSAISAKMRKLSLLAVVFVDLPFQAYSRGGAKPILEPDQLTDRAERIRLESRWCVLQDNGGGILKMPLLPDGPAIDQGKAIGVTTDQRGLPRLFDSLLVTNTIGGDGSDIGAFELFP